MPVPKKIIKEIGSIESLLKEGSTLLNLTIQSLDLKKTNIDWTKIKLANTTFLGCEMSEETELLLRKKGAMIYPKIVGIPYNPYRSKLYSWEELMDGYDFDPKKDQSLDLKIYNHYNSYKNISDINETLAERIHDHAIDNAIIDMIGMDETGMTTKKCIGIMGGHGISRADISYEKIAFIAKTLTENGYFILSGGGPGIMEAANLGAYFAGKKEEDLRESIEILKLAPLFTDKDNVTQSQKVIEKYKKGTESLAIPTWFYGHEPSNLFATKIAKYFSNAIREEILLSTALYGIIYAPGSSGTMEEVFTDIAQNHYVTFGYTSPMIFFGKEFWSEKTKVYDVVCNLSKGLRYDKMLAISDEPSEIIDFIKNHPPAKK